MNDHTFGTSLHDTSDQVSIRTKQRRKRVSAPQSYVQRKNKRKTGKKNTLVRK